MTEQHGFAAPTLPAANPTSSTPPANTPLVPPTADGIDPAELRRSGSPMLAETSNPTESLQSPSGLALPPSGAPTLSPGIPTLPPAGAAPLALPTLPTLPTSAPSAPTPASPAPDSHTPASPTLAAPTPASPTLEHSAASAAPTLPSASAPPPTPAPPSVPGPAPALEPAFEPALSAAPDAVAADTSSTQPAPSLPAIPTTVPTTVPTSVPATGPAIGAGVAPNATTSQPTTVDQFGLPPLDPNASRTAPSWKKRKKSKLRKLRNVLLTLGVLGGLGYGGYLAYQEFAPAAEPPPALPLDDPDTLIGQSNDLTTEINDNVDEVEALDQLGLDPVGEPIVADNGVIGAPASSEDSALTALSYGFRVTTPEGPSYDVQVDTATGDFVFSTENGEVRRVGGQMYVRQPDLTWATMDATLDEATFVGLDHVVTFGDVVPEAALPFVTYSELDENGFGVYVIDDVAFFENDPAARADWIAAWGDAQSAAPDRTAASDVVFPPNTGPGDIYINVIGDANGVVQSASVTSVSIGGTEVYELIGWSSLSAPVAAPPID